MIGVGVGGKILIFSTLLVSEITANLKHYLQTLNLVKPKRLYLSSSKAKNKVSFHDFAHRSLALVKQPAKLELEVQVDGKKDDCILVDHTEICQVIANGKLSCCRNAVTSYSCHETHHVLLLCFIRQ